MIQSDLKKRYRSVIEDMNILRNFMDEQEGNGGQRPAHTFNQLMLSMNQVKTNVENMLADQITESMGDLDVIVKKFI
jgi:superoxide dismutase